MREKKKRSKDASVSEKRKIGGAVAALIAAVKADLEVHR